MHWFCKQGTTAVSGAKAVAGVALQTLKESQRTDIESLLEEISAFIESQADNESARRLAGALESWKISDDDPLTFHFARRLLECIPRAVLAHTRGDEVEAWKLVASASLSGGAGLSEAVRRKERIRSATSGHWKDHERKQAVWRWLTDHRDEYPSDKSRIDAMTSNEVGNVARGTLQRYVTAYNKAHQTSRAPAGRRKKAIPLRNI